MSIWFALSVNSYPNDPLSLLLAKTGHKSDVWGITTLVNIAKMNHVHPWRDVNDVINDELLA